MILSFILAKSVQFYYSIFIIINKYLFLNEHIRLYGYLCPSKCKYPTLKVIDYFYDLKSYV